MKLVNHSTKETSSYTLDNTTPLHELLKDIIDFDLSRTFGDNQKRSIVITAKPQRKH